MSNVPSHIGTPLIAELSILRDFIDFLNEQIGVYSDCISGFYGNTTRVERQIARIVHPANKGAAANGVIVYTSVEDPSSPDIVHHRVIRASNYLDANSELGHNEQQVCRAIVVLVFAEWDEFVRPKIAKLRGAKANDIQLDAFGDIRILRQTIVHARGQLALKEHVKLKRFAELFKPDAQLVFGHDTMHKLIIGAKQSVAELIQSHAAKVPEGFQSDRIVDVAISGIPRVNIENGEE